MAEPAFAAVTKGNELRTAFRQCTGALLGVGVLSGVINLLGLTGSLLYRQVNRPNWIVGSSMLVYGERGQVLRGALMEFAELFSARNRIVRCVLAVLLATATSSSNAHAETLPQRVGSIAGRASVVDGDTIEIHGERIRFNGVDAPESSQLCLDAGGRKYRCGSMSANALADFLGQSTPTTCELVERDRHGRFVGNCYRADGTSVQEWLVLNGFALDWERYSGGAYAKLQEDARSRNSGLWSGSFENPWDWRANKRVPAAAVPLSAQDGGGCRIKGNISASGERIYHVPGQEHYARTGISENKGERWFCTADEAVSAGWRPAAR
ncbi:thermonuclease family protein [Mesorhizobium sp. LHD-90]|uniref:thermonuclease family protein n=1 Tax=Mesorhizobium sp. LHD-90 TaxID=3071414 RepID=UPI0027E05E4C|nr:thermonuclease family protein [Mesorhizobium sp. LHD-90]MDQ6436362.1 thermonuclease family protein [Mesorhizobium sp. LHD-90]